jgi:hypothetical protein
MAVDRRVSFTGNPNTDKIVKVKGDPDSYKKLNICWQFSLMDFDFQYGWNNVISRIQFTPSIKNDIEILLLENECAEDLYNSLAKLNTTDFVNIHSFFQRLQNIPHISTKDLLSILSVMKENFFWNEIFPKLKDIETKKWFELEIEQFGKNGKSKNHWVHIRDIIKPARNRLKELNMDDVEELFSIRLTGKQRVWGIRDFNYFKMIWFDFEHEICPSNRD